MKKRLTEEQVEEMSNEIYETLMLEAECPLSGMDCSIIADLLISKGYRKIHDDHARQCTCYALGCQMAEELKKEFARKIFGDIYDRLLQSFPPQAFVDAPCATHDRIFDMISELKKKYERESESEDTE